jgi:protein-disulfide isomerase
MATRRAIIGLGAVALGYVALTKGGPALWARLGPLPEFSTEGMPAGFRKQVGAAELSAGLANPLIGIDDGAAPQPADTLDDAALCRALFADVSPGRVPLSYFTDYNCPYCRVLGRDLREFALARPDSAQLIHHELPLLGVSSVLGAHAALAARKQAAYDLMHARLNTGVVRITQSYIEALAGEFGLDAQQLLADMSAPEVAAQLSLSKGAAQRFGVIGTPFLLIGRTAIFGRIDPTTLERIFEDELASEASYSCAV